MGYLETLSSFDLTLYEWSALFLAMVVLGIGKAGIKGF